MSHLPVRLARVCVCANVCVCVRVWTRNAQIFSARGGHRADGRSIRAYVHVRVCARVHLYVCSISIAVVQCVAIVFVVCVRIVCKAATRNIDVLGYAAATE